MRVNSFISVEKNHVPKTMNCIHESIQYTTMKKYTINASYKKVPIQVFSQLNQIDDHFRAWHLPHVSYIVDRTPSGNAQMVIEFSSNLSHVNATIITPVSGYKYVQVPLHQQSVFEGMSVNKAVSHPMWHAVMDNTRFSVTNLYKVLQGHSKTCTVYRKLWSLLTMA